MAEDRSTSLDMVEHEKTYDSFVKMTKWGVIFVILLLALMAIFLV